MPLPEEVPVARPEAPLLVAFPEPAVPVLPPDAAVVAVDPVRTVAVALGTVVAPLAMTEVPLTVDTADAVAVTPLVLGLTAAIRVY